MTFAAVSVPNKPSSSEAPEKIGACPVCGGVLEVGKASVHGTFWGFLLVSWSWQHFWVQPALGREEAVLKSGRSCKGYRCRDCRFVGVKGA